MKNIVFQTKELAKAIKKSNEYNQYQRIRQNLKKDMELKALFDAANNSQTAYNYGRKAMR